MAFLVQLTTKHFHPTEGFTYPSTLTLSHHVGRHVVTLDELK